MHDLNAPAIPTCDDSQDPSIKTFSLETIDKLHKALDVLASIRKDIVGGQEERMQDPNIGSLMEAAEAQSVLAGRILNEVTGIAGLLGVQR